MPDLNQTDEWMKEAERLIEDYAAARAETAVFNVTQASGMKVRMARPRLRALLSHLFRRPAVTPLSEWQPIETAPKHTEVLCWREDQGVFISQLTTPEAVVPEDELEKCEFPDDFEEWFHEVWGWQEGSERPTHWMPLPEGPAAIERAISAAPTEQVHSAAIGNEAPCGLSAEAPDAQLCKFYGVTTFPALVSAMLYHIEKLQAKRPQTPSLAPQRVREG